MNNRATIIDKTLAATFLKLLPKWVTPNHITILRFLMIPPIILLVSIGEYFWGFIIFFIAAFSDALDGALARTANQVTDWGKMFDPLADKLLIGTVGALLVPHFFGVGIILAIIGVELIIILYSYYRKHYEGITIEAKKAGKAKMIFQSLGLGFLFLYILVPVSWLFTGALLMLYASLVFALISLVVYRSA